MNSHTPSYKTILDLCGGTGSWSKPYRDAGYDVRVVTIPEYDVTKWRTYNWLTDLMQSNQVHGILAAPPCTMFSFARTKGNITPRNLRQGMETVISCMEIVWECQYGLVNQYSQKPTLKFWCLENPNGHLKYFIGQPVFEFDPYEFGDAYSKKTHLWGWFNAPTKTHDKNARTLGKKFDALLMPEIRSISTNIFRDKATRQELRSITPPGFAKAFFLANR